MDTKEYHQKYYEAHREKKKQQSKEYKKQTHVPCPVCGKLHDKRSEFCKSCAIRIGYRTGKRKGWKGGYRSVWGYIRLLQPEHPRADKRGYVCEHIVIWEQAHGKSLPKGWIVHHLNGIRSDNRATNLVALPNKKHRHILEVKAKRIQELEALLKNQGHLL